jgi:predicted nucleic acid-binding protein
MIARRFIDTNILLYSISRDPREARKREHAIALLQEDDLALSVQVLQEFYVQATRASRSDPLPHDLAAGLVHAWRRFPVQDITIGVLLAALELKAQHGFSYWDSAIVAAARALGCRELFSEDLSHGQQIDGLLIVNPFR